MIGFLLGRRWRDRGRLLFRYHDGRRWRSADPIVIWQLLESHTGYRHSRDFAEAMAGDETKQAAAVDAACSAFDVQPFQDGQGLTIPERLSLLAGFDEYASMLRSSLGLAAIGRRVQPAVFDDHHAAPAESLEAAEPL